jgi:hypothetical protein
VHNGSEEAIQARLRSPRSELEDAYLGTPLGERMAPVKWSSREVQFPMNRYAIKTLVVYMKEARK